MTNDMISRLMAAGLTKQQATSVTAEALVNLFMPDDGKILMREAQGRVKEMECTSLCESFRSILSLSYSSVIASSSESCYNPVPLCLLTDSTDG